MSRNSTTDVTPDAGVDPDKAAQIQKRWDDHKDYTSKELPSGLVAITKIPDYIEELDNGKRRGPYL